ncbi:MAG: glutamine synthetase family protein [Candidatus Aminicenantes bacterium]|nr:glutamine synthetase family protein [Candidatus Aminicenantes bacterium]
MAFKESKNIFSLTNPLCFLLDKESSDFRVEDFFKVIEKKEIEKIIFHYVGLDGKLKELWIPVTELAQVEMVLYEGERVDGSSLFKGLIDESLSDLYVVPVYKTAFINPFDPHSLDFICRYLTPDGHLAPFAPDNILAKAVTNFRANSGLDLYALGELEFFLIKEKTTFFYPNEKQKGYHASAPYLKSGEILDEIVKLLAQITGAVKYAHAEVGYIESVRSDNKEIMGKEAEQLEVEFLPRPIEEMGDWLVLARWLIRQVAFRHNCLATFTPKLEEGVAGNGLHLHLELRQNGKNIMVGPDGSLSEEARRLIGGLIEYADSLTAFGNTVSSSYLRLVPHQEAPTRVCWSDLNRSALIRVPLGWRQVGKLAKVVNPQVQIPEKERVSRQTIELRIPDGSAHIYLLLAGITMAADWAFRKDESLFQQNWPLELVAEYYVKGSIFDDPELLKKLPLLPTSCLESSRLLLAKRHLYERDGVFPSAIIDYMAKLLAAEDDEFMNEKLAKLPADDRLHETRRIMHKDLHRH